MKGKEGWSEAIHSTNILCHPWVNLTPALNVLCPVTRRAHADGPRWARGTRTPAQVRSPPPYHALPFSLLQTLPLDPPSLARPSSTHPLIFSLFWSDDSIAAWWMWPSRPRRVSGSWRGTSDGGAVPRKGSRWRGPSYSAGTHYTCRIKKARPFRGS